jgi:hypothetical protein
VGSWVRHISWWVSAWNSIARHIGFTAASWMSASILSFVVAAVVTLLAGGLTAAARWLGGGDRAGAGSARQAEPGSAEPA